MKPRQKPRALSQRMIDDIVVAQADDKSAWGKPIRVRAARRASVALTAELAARAAFFARLHREASLQDWVLRVIQERIELEETALARVKRDLLTARSGS